MDIVLTKEQFRELLLLAELGNHVRAAALEADGQYDPERDEALMSSLYEMAYEAGLGEVEADSDRMEENAGAIVPTSQFEETVHEILESYDDDQFWHELSTLLGKRDFERTATPEELAELAQNNGWLPDRVQEIYDRYEQEFETYGIDRLEINAGAPVSDLRDLLG